MEKARGKPPNISIDGGREREYNMDNIPSKLALVTNNMHEFESVDGLLLENWI